MAKKDMGNTVKKMEHGATIMHDTRQVSNKVGGNPKATGKPQEKGGTKSRGGAKSAHSQMGLSMGTRVTSRETRHRPTSGDNMKGKRPY